MSPKISERRSIRLLLFILAPLALLACAIVALDSSDAVAQKDLSPNADTLGLHRAAYDECMNIVREIYARMTPVPGNDSVCSFTCHVETFVVDTANLKNSVADVEVRCNLSRVEVKSHLFEMYKDSTDIFTVIPESRMVYVGDARGVMMADGNAYGMPWMRDSLISRCSIEECADQRDSTGVVFKRVVLKPDPHARRYFGISEMELVFDVDRKEIRRAAVKPATVETYAQVVWTLSPCRVDVAPTEFRTPVVQRFLTPQSLLAPQWKGYKLVDNRSIATADVVR